MTSGANKANGPRRKLPAAATAAIPVTAPHATPAMSAEEAAPALEAALLDSDIAAATLLPPEAAATIDPIPAIQSPKPDADPVLADTTAISANATKDMHMDTTTIDTATDQTQAQGHAMFADANDRAKGAMEKGTKFFAEMTEFNKGNIEAMVESSKIAARGLETMGQDAATYAKTSFEGVTAAMRTLATVKSPTEFMKFQADYARTAFDAMIAQTSRSTEASLKLAGEVAQPISNRVALAAEKVKIAA